jgi:hypothetical protein
MILTKYHKKYAETILNYCKNNGLEETASLAFWNCLVRIFKSMEVLKARAAKISEAQGTSTNKASPKFPSEGAFMEWASSKGFNCSQAASTYEWFARKLRA